MPRILIIGYDPDSVDFSDPGSPPGLDIDKIWAGAKASLKRIEDYGWTGVQCMVRPDDTAAGVVERALSDAKYDCIVIGGGVRLAYNSVPVFENIVDAVRRSAPGTPLAFNEGPEKSLEAAKRWLERH
ncbi:hypothetical protein SAMN05216548_106130 [Faunimonas pinastri]|uniref:Uncharacterized protein n=1 Tax=Faunimonas pinastri TaxID=1855383 RepID=A0A1H9HR28_9HYPH|nr:hypothetical protein [Faunimonas pinastri]SEQ64771.1 hypothetical protein SAMN05216548_106130 [Faunimonas pinastri]